jgi:haloalkane dehalogenase
VTSREVIAEHRAAGRLFEAGGVGSFVREAGRPAQGDPVLCIHGVPASNTMVAVEHFKRQWSMEPFARRGIGEAYLRVTTRRTFRMLMYLMGIGDRAAVSAAEVDAYLDLLRGDDAGHAFLRIMRGFERTSEKQVLYQRVLRDGRYPKQIVWGANDPALKLAVHGDQARLAAGLDEIHTVPAKHFLQEDQAPAVAEHIVRLARA